MILKILLTLAVVIGVVIWFRAQKTKQASAIAQAQTQGRLINPDVEKNSWLKPLLYSLAGLSIAVGILIYYLSWMDDHTQYQITITNPQTGSSETYIALKKDMFGRRFITEGGLQINASDLDRIEIKKFDSSDD